MSIYQQLQDYCDCKITEGDSSEKNIDELVHIVSNATCWAGEGSTCSTFLMSERQETLKLPTCPDKCFVYEFKPFYHPFDVGSFNFVIVEEDGIEQKLIELTSDDFVYSDYEEVFKIKLPYAHDCKCEICKCKKKYKLVVTYDAGYEEIPECLLPVFCEMLDLIARKNKCDCECDACHENPNYDNKTDYGDYTTGDMLTSAIITEIGPIMTNNYKEQIGLISLCEPEYVIYGEVL